MLAFAALVAHAVYEGLFGLIALVRPLPSLDATGRTFSRFFGSALLGLATLSAVAAAFNEETIVIFVASVSIATAQTLETGVCLIVALQRLRAQQDPALLDEHNARKPPPSTPIFIVTVIHCVFAAIFAFLAVTNRP